MIPFALINVSKREPKENSPGCSSPQMASFWPEGLYYLLPDSKRTGNSCDLSYETDWSLLTPDWSILEVKND